MLQTVSWQLVQTISQIVYMFSFVCSQLTWSLVIYHIFSALWKTHLSTFFVAFVNFNCHCLNFTPSLLFRKKFKTIIWKNICLHIAETPAKTVLWLNTKPRSKKATAAHKQNINVSNQCSGRTSVHHANAIFA